MQHFEIPLWISEMLFVVWLLLLIVGTISLFMKISWAKRMYLWGIMTFIIIQIAIISYINS